MMVAAYMTALVFGAAGMAWAARRALRSGAARTTTAVACAGGAVALAAWTAYAAMGGVSCEAPWLGPLTTLAVAVAVACTVLGPGVRARMTPATAQMARVVGLGAGVAAGVFVLEWPYNPDLFSMEPAFVRLNAALVGAGLLATWFLAQRRRAGVLVFTGACLAFGIANCFLCLFKGQTVLPADVLALGTAAEVSAGYDFVLTDAPVAALAVYALLVAAWAFVPAGRITRIGVARNLTCGLAVLAIAVNWYCSTDIEQRYGVKVDVWATRASYMEYGSVPGFLQRMQEIEPHVPAGYSVEGAAHLQGELAERWDDDHPGYPQTAAQAAAYQEALTGTAQLPDIVVVMNESFADLSCYPGVQGYEGTTVFDAIDAQLRGLVYTSVRGGGTCNSEFEYLTGTTLGSMGGGVYPYMFYNLEDAESLAKSMGALGYRATAVHPAAASNWRRDVVYRQLGFGAFLSEDDFAPDAATLRELVADGPVYDKALDVLAAAPDDEPQFVFEVTLQNHGGYTTGLLGEGAEGGTTVNGVAVEGMDEYLGCIASSEADLAAFLERLEDLDRKVVVVFFGDHQPGFNDEVAEAAYATPVDELSLEQVQMRFATPYMIWANFNLDLDDRGFEALDTSLNYLGAMTAFAAGLPLTAFQKAQLELQAQMPAVNLNGYRDAQGAWYWIGQDGPARDAYDAYEVLQYADLFDARGNGAFEEFCATEADAGISAQ